MKTETEGERLVRQSNCGIKKITWYGLSFYRERKRERGGGVVSCVIDNICNMCSFVFCVLIEQCWNLRCSGVKFLLCFEGKC